MFYSILKEHNLKYYVFLGLFSLLFVIEVAAKCGSAVTVYPYGTTIDPSGHILIEASGWRHEILDKLDVDFPVYLNSLEGQVKLRKQNFITGQKWMSQILLVPEERLKNGVTYVLVIEGLYKDDSAFLLNPNRLYHNNGFNGARWTVSKIKQTSTTVLEANTQITNFKRYGCGPAVETIFDFEDLIHEDQIIQAEILDEESSIRTSFYVVVKGGKITVGHGMCSGPYNFKEGRSYQIRLSNVKVEKEKFTVWMKCKNPWDNAPRSQFD